MTGLAYPGAERRYRVLTVQAPLGADPAAILRASGLDLTDAIAFHRPDLEAAAVAVERLTVGEVLARSHADKPVKL